VIQTANPQKEKRTELLKVMLKPSEMARLNKTSGGKGKRSKWVANLLNKFTAVS
jgi:hypothetical protein